MNKTYLKEQNHTSQAAPGGPPIWEEAPDCEGRDWEVARLGRYGKRKKLHKELGREDVFFGVFLFLRWIYLWFIGIWI